MNSSTPTPHTASEVTVSSLLAGAAVPDLQPDASCGLIHVTPQVGVDVLLWRAHFPRPLTMSVRDDWDRVHFSCALQGRCRFAMRERGGEIERVLEENTSCINYTPGCSSKSSYAGSFEQVTVSVRPDLLADWMPELGGSLRRDLAAMHCCNMQRCGAEMQTTAHALSQALQAASAQPDLRPTASPLWLLGQALVLVSLSVEAHCEQTPSQQQTLRPALHKKLLRARDLLLADLSKAPTITALARETGLSVAALKRGFRQLFDHSIYGLFQQERMHMARQRLCSGHTPVTVVAADLGYTNASHFTAAFRKQFGVNPCAFKHQR
ncbi:AraC family transcriptional regulator [Xanthomonas arboricola]|uniref:helix-turn-helix transcriptional regulator n=1 Tax=Xanthomonas TaxID=338 RepID=UPI000CED8A10|nr:MULTISPECIES: AraC family transcriptional regulator [Xanthomonas]MBB5736250.1 AraC family transcriptional regulator [Xanthomonas sp. CFBP 8152]PPT74832.1 AraC family transcriptional regulator [Xanthomonas arboricola]